MVKINDLLIQVSDKHCNDDHVKRNGVIAYCRRRVSIKGCALEQWFQN